MMGSRVVSVLAFVSRAAVAITCAACAEDATGPRILAVTPSAGAASLATPVEISGERFRPAMIANYDDEAQSSISIRFSATLGGHALQSVTYVDEGKLTALVPAGLVTGRYTLIVVDPSGAEGTLADAFEVRTHDGDLGPADGGRDGPNIDAGPADSDIGAPDAGGFKPVSAKEIGDALAKQKVQCVDHNGNVKGGQIPIVDSSTVTLVQGSVTLAGAPGDTKAWVGKNPSVTVIWNPNACDREYPYSNSNSWDVAGLLVRRAERAGGKLMLKPGVTAADIDVINVHPSGAFQGTFDFFKPDDSQLSAHPQLVNTVNAAKAALLKVATQ